MRPPSFLPRLFAAGILAFPPAALVGCGGPPVGQVRGTVTYKGEPVTAGQVEFHRPEHGLGFVAKLDAGGGYKIPEPLPTGEYQVCVSPPWNTPEDKVAPKARTPRKAQNITTSDLTVTVAPGPNTVPIELKD